MNMILLCLLALVVSIHGQCYRGTNLAGLDFGGGSLPGQYGKDYISPNTGEVDYFMGKGMNTFRIPFLWERMQPQANGPFDATYLSYVNNLVTYITNKGGYALIDPHNYARYYGTIIGTGNVPASVYQNFWTQLAKVFMQNDHVLFGLMNEPNSMSTELWLADANAAISAIRSVGANNLILVPGNAWTGAWSWYGSWYGTPNAVVMKGVVDPKNNYAIEVHQYLDSDDSGSHEECVSTTIGSERLTNFTVWARQNNVKAFVGEWAGGRTTTCYQAIQDDLQFIDNNKDVYIGWTWWAAGPWWGDYMYALDPSNGQDRPQMQYLVPHVCH